MADATERSTEINQLVAEQARDDRTFATKDLNNESIDTGDLDDEALEAGVLDDELDAELADADLYDGGEELSADLVQLDEDIEDEADEVIGEDDDNPFEDPDEALPDDREEHAIEQYNKQEASLGDDT